MRAPAATISASAPFLASIFKTCLLPGAGNMDYGDFFSRLRSVGYDGHTLIEVYRSNFGAPEEMLRAVRLLSRYASV